MKKFEESYNSIDSLFKTLNSNFSKHIEELDGRIRSLNEELEGIENDISEVEYQIENYDEDEDG